MIFDYKAHRKTDRGIGQPKTTPHFYPEQEFFPGRAEGRMIPIIPGVDSASSARLQAALPTDKPINRKIEDFYDNSLLEELEREGFLKTLGKIMPPQFAT
jgi:hypothetical protein